MEHSLLERAKAFLRTRRRQKAWYRTLYGLAGVVIFVTTYMLILPAITMERPAQCGIEEHAHTAECYETVPSRTVRTLNCKLAFSGTVVHTHDENCYDENGTLICMLPEIREHVHTAECYATEKTLICDQIEGSGSSTEDLFTDVPSGFDDPLSAFSDGGHTHTEVCWQETYHLTCVLPEVVLHVHGEGCRDEEGNLICTQPEVIAHQHTDECFDMTEIPEQQKLICGKEEHIHTEACYPEEEDIFVEEVEVPEEENNGVITIAPTPTVGAEEAEDITETPNDNENEPTPTEEPEPSEIPEEADETSEGEDEVIYEAGIITVGADSDEDSGSFCTVSRESRFVEEEELLTAGVFSLMSIDNGVMLTGTDTAIDFTDYLTATNIQKLSNGIWENSTSFTDGDQVRVELYYSMPANIVTADNRVISYQLPSGVKPLENESGPVKHDGVTVGSYVVDTNGLVTITFNPSFANGESFTGRLRFDGTMSSAEAASDGKIVFPGTGTTITVKEKTEVYDISTNKKSTVVDRENKQVTYEIEASTVKGTNGQTVTIKDSFGDSDTKIKYDAGSFVVEKIDASGNTTTVDISSDSAPIISDKTNGQQEFIINNLPALAAGEKYVVRYSAAYTLPVGGDGSGNINNSANASFNGNDGHWKYVNVELSKAMISKGGSYDNSNNVINWTLTVNNNQQDIGGYTISDTLPDGLKFTKNVEIYGSNGQLVATVEGTKDGNSLSYTFPENSSDVYTIQYQTTAPEANGNVTNDAEIKDKNGNGYQSSGVVGVTHRTWGVTKQAMNSETDNGGVTRYQWQSNITIPDSGLNKSVTYTDTILEPKEGGNPVSKSGDFHYGIASELEGKIKTTFSAKIKTDTGIVEKGWNDFSELVESIAIIYYDEMGNAVSSTDASTHVQKFAFTIVPKVDSELTVQNIRFEYQTIVDYSLMDTNSTWTFYNTGSIPDVTPAEAAKSYTKPKPLVKYSGIKDANGYITYKNDTTKVDYNLQNGELYYRLLITTSPGQSGDIVITDVLPEGTELIDGSVEARFYRNENSVYEKDYDHTVYPAIEYDLTGEKKPVITVDGRKLGITIFDGYNLNETGRKSGQIISITYSLQIVDDDWNDYSIVSKYYENTATWNTTSDSQKTEVTREVKELIKTGEQLQGVNEEGETEKLNQVKYSVLINPAGKDLNPESETLILKDIMEVPGTAIGVSLQLETVKLYNMDTKGNILGDMPVSEYTLDYSSPESNKRLLTISLPDSRPCKLEYVYEIEGKGNAATDQSLTNTVELEGIYSTRTESKFIETSSDADVAKAKVKIYKVDSENYSKRLSGAEFRLEKWAVSDGSTAPSWIDCGNFATSDNGELVLSLGTGAGTVQYDVLYRLTEENAPVGYQKSSKLYYFVLMDLKTNPSQEVYKTYNIIHVQNNNFLNGSAGNGQAVQQGDIQFLGQSGGVIYVPNTSTSIGVRKIWMDSNGNSVQKDDGQITVDLYRMTKKPVGNVVTVNLTYLGWSEDPNPPKPYACGSVNLVVEPGGRLEYRTSNGEWSNVEYMLSCFRHSYNGTGNVTVTADSSTPARAVIAIDAVNESESTLNICMIGTSYDNVSASKEDVLKNFVYTEPTNYDIQKAKLGTLTLSKAGVAFAPEDGVTGISAIGSDWSAVVEGLNPSDADGNPYYYTIEEVDGAQYNVQYTNNNGITKGDIFVKNTIPDQSTTAVTVTKKWLNSDGTEKTSWPADLTVTFQLKSKKYNSSGIEVPESELNVGDVQTLNNTRTSALIENLPKSVVENNETYTYKYFVEELKVNGIAADSNYEVTYDGNGAVSGTITISNKEKVTVMLPETGGPGTYLYTLGGLLLAGYAGLLLYIQNKRRKGDRRSS